MIGHYRTTVRMQEKMNKLLELALLALIGWAMLIMFSIDAKSEPYSLEIKRISLLFMINATNTKYEYYNLTYGKLESLTEEDVNNFISGGLILKNINCSVKEVLLTNNPYELHVNCESKSMFTIDSNGYAFTATENPIRYNQDIWNDLDLDIKRIAHTFSWNYLKNETFSWSKLRKLPDLDYYDLSKSTQKEIEGFIQLALYQDGIPCRIINIKKHTPVSVLATVQLLSGIRSYCIYSNGTWK